MKWKKINYKTSERLCYIMGSTGLVIALIGGLTDVEWLGYAGCIAVTVGVIQTFIFCRCPRCGAILGNRYGVIGDKCQSCGRKLVK